MSFLSQLFQRQTDDERASENQARKRLGLTGEALAEDAMQAFAIHRPQYIARELQSLVQNTARVSLHHQGALVASGPTHSWDSGRNQVKISVEQGEPHSVALLQGMNAVAWLDGVKYQFPVRKVIVTHDDHLLIPRPEVLWRIQRRDAFRIGPKSGTPLILELQYQTPGWPSRAPVFDLSAGGISLRVMGQLIPAIGSIAHRCLLVLPDVGSVVTDLEVKHVDRGNPGWLVGCAFIDLPGNMETLIQRWVIATERARNARFGEASSVDFTD